ncbi:MAG: metallophosphoesterase [Pseudomonadota bacterium]
MTDTLTIAHCSDIHLDADTRDIDFYRHAFERVLTVMVERDPDLLIVAGDIFDANSATDATIRWAMDLLGRLMVPIVMIPGNHDCLEGDSIYRRYDFNAIRNVDMFLDAEGETRHFPALDLAVWGKGMLDHTPDHRPLAGAPERPVERRWYVGLGHGLYVPDGQTTGRSSPIAHQEIAGSPFDYVALGHHHAAFTLDTERGAAAFSGSPTDTVGGAPTYAWAELTPSGTSVDIVPVAD